MSDTVTMHEAAQRLGVSNSKIWRLVKEGLLPARSNPLDARQKLIKLDDLQKLETQDEPRPRFVSDGIASKPDAVRSDEVEEYLREHWHRPC